jgi:hypothetical protein
MYTTGGERSFWTISRRAESSNLKLRLLHTFFLVKTCPAVLTAVSPTF